MSCQRLLRLCTREDDSDLYNCLELCEVSVAGLIQEEGDY